MTRAGREDRRKPWMWIQTFPSFRKTKGQPCSRNRQAVNLENLREPVGRIQLDYMALPRENSVKSSNSHNLNQDLGFRHQRDHFVCANRFSVLRFQVSRHLSLRHPLSETVYAQAAARLVRGRRVNSFVGVFPPS